MWTCPKCDSKVDDKFPACQSCGTRADGTTAIVEAPRNGIKAPGAEETEPPPLMPVELPPPAPPSMQTRLLLGARDGAIYFAMWGALYGVMMFSGLSCLAQAQFPEGHIQAALGAVLGHAIIGAMIGAPVGVLWAAIRPPRRPRPPRI